MKYYRENYIPTLNMLVYTIHMKDGRMLIPNWFDKLIGRLISWLQGNYSKKDVQEQKSFVNFLQWVWKDAEQKTKREKGHYRRAFKAIKGLI